MKTTVTDLWYKADKTKKNRHGHGLRWLGRWEHQSQRGSKAFDTKSEARQWVRKQKHAHDQDQLVLSGTATLARYINQWLTQHAGQAATVVSYKTCINKHILPALGDAPIANIQDHHVERLYRSMTKTAPTQIPKVHTILNQVFRQARKERLIHASPMQSVDKPATKAVKASVAVLTPPQVNLICETLSPPDRMLFRVAVETGLRPGELAALAVEDVDLDAGLLHVRRAMKQPWGLLGTTKTGAVRSVPMSAKVAEIASQCALTAIPVKVEQDSTLGGGYTVRSFLFPAPGEQHYEAPLPHHLWASGRFKTALRQAGIDIPGQSLYITRHTYASSLIRAGVDIRRVSELMGHANATMTLNIYSHLFDKDWSDVTDHLDGLYD